MSDDDKNNVQSVQNEGGGREKQLSDRKKTILKAVIDAHIDNGEPVGSRFLMTNKQIALSSATIRNEMAELEEMGYLEQPHTSSGRVPSELGYRFYVDSLMESYVQRKRPGGAEPADFKPRVGSRQADRTRVEGHGGADELHVAVGASEAETRSGAEIQDGAARFAQLPARDDNQREYREY